MAMVKVRQIVVNSKREQMPTPMQQDGVSIEGYYDDNAEYIEDLLAQTDSFGRAPIRPGNPTARPKPKAKAKFGAKPKVGEGKGKICT